VTGDRQLQFLLADEPASARASLTRRWLMLMHEILPQMADRHDWPISQNHCFMRVCLDTSIGTPWHMFVKRPALRHMSDDQLRHTVAIAERCVETPSLLFELNSRSIEYRKQFASHDRSIIRKEDHVPHPIPDPALADQESVWNFPRPARAEPTISHLKIVHRGVTIAETRQGVRTLETSHPPSYYFPRADVTMALFSQSLQRSFCEWKGDATYFDITVKGELLRDVAWSYPRPTDPFLVLRDHLAFYAAPFDTCFVDGEKAVPQPGEFYGGWITSKVAGPFKGIPGSRSW
jgi:uncharacterized protein (DUF427 family)